MLLLPVMYSSSKIVQVSFPETCKTRDVLNVEIGKILKYFIRNKLWIRRDTGECIRKES